MNIWELLALLYLAVGVGHATSSYLTLSAVYEETGDSFWKIEGYEAFSLILLWPIFIYFTLTEPK